MNKDSNTKMFNTQQNSPDIVARHSRIGNGFLDNSSVRFAPRDNATVANAWRILQPGVQERKLVPISGSFNQLVSDQFGNLKNVDVHFENENKQLLLKKENGLWIADKIVNKNWKLPNVDECVNALMELPYPCVYARSIGGGRLINFAWDIGGSDIGGERVQRYVNAFIANDKDISHTFMTSAVNGWCLNAFLMHKSIAEIGFNVRHNSPTSAEEYIAFVVDLRSRLAGQGDRMQEFLNRMTRKFVTRDETERILSAAFNPGRMPSKVNLSGERVEKIVEEMEREGSHAPVLDTLSKSQRDYANTVKRTRAIKQLAREAMERYEKIDRRPHAGTAYHVYQAVTEVSSWRTESRRTGNVGDSILAGTRGTEIQNASEAIAELIQ